MGKTVRVTSTSSGIGRATAKLFAARGWNVADGAAIHSKLPAMTPPERRPGAIAAQFWKASAYVEHGIQRNKFRPLAWFANVCSHPDSR